jgi:UDP-hydrolysing UDP-N-acetyl-D-glucosamine 2-epimerase
VAVLTTGRQDYGILRSTIRALESDPRFTVLLYAGGMHCSPRFGHTIDLLRADTRSIARELPFLAEPPAQASDAAEALRMIADALAADAPDALVLLGDRSETLAAAAAATLVRVPLVHLHGGEESEGAVDNAFRHAITKLAHLHLVSHADHAVRVLQMGEPPENVSIVGAPGLDHLFRDDLPEGPGLAAALGLPLERPLVLVTVHPTTLSEADDPAAEARAVGEALEGLGGTVVITQPNADRGGASISAFWTRWADGRRGVLVADALGETLYWALMRQADVMVGNSSSGVIEAPAAGLPVVNVGDRQRGRLRAVATVDVAPEAAAIRRAIDAALAPGRRAAVAAMPTPYPAGPAAPRIVAALAEWLPRRTLRKAFHRLGA